MNPRFTVFRLLAEDVSALLQRNELSWERTFT